MTDPSEIAQALADYTEKAYGFISIYKNPGPHSCDNLILVTATAHVLFPEVVTIERVETLLTACECEPGVLVRYPGCSPNDQVASHDDHVAAACVSPRIAGRILQHAKWSLWTFGSPWPITHWLGRIIDFAGTIKSAAEPIGAPVEEKKLDLMDCILWSIGIAASCLTSRGNTDGKCLAVFKIHAMKGKNYPICETAIQFWKSVMTWRYPGGLRELQAIRYQDPGHPFRRYAPEDFK